MTPDAAPGIAQAIQFAVAPALLLVGIGNLLNVVAVRLEDWGLGGPEPSDDLERTVADFVGAVTAAAERLRSPMLVVVCPPSSELRNDEQAIDRAVRRAKTSSNFVRQPRRREVTP